MIQQKPNIAVWNSVDQYIKSAELLLKHRHPHSPFILASLGVELLLKSFLAEQLAPWTAKTKRLKKCVTKALLWSNGLRTIRIMNH